MDLSSQHIDENCSLNLKVEDQSFDLDLVQMNKKLDEYICRFTADLERDHKMVDYLKQINLTKQAILESYRGITQRNRKMLNDSLSNSVAKKAAITYFSFVLIFLEAKPIDQLDSKGRLVWYIEVEIKLSCCLQLFQNYKPKDDISNSPRQQYQKVWDRCKFQPVNDLAKIKTEYKNMKRIFYISTAASIIESQYSISLVQKVIFGLSLPRYYIMNDQAKLKSFQFYRNPTLKFTQQLWNFFQLGGTKELAKLTYQSITTNMKLYIPADGQYSSNLNIFEERPNTITVRLLHNRPIIKIASTKQAGGKSQHKKQARFLQTVMIHMHGGGFVSLSSRSTQAYTRKWANQLGIPIFSIDYRMPPDHPFPQAPLDCFTVYKFLIDHIHQFINVRPKYIYMGGDSAGASLSCSVTGLLLKYKEVLPLGLYLAYPATDLRYNFTSSRMYSLTDPLLWPSNMLVCLHAYLEGDLQKASDPLLSPILLSQQYVNGSKDQRFPLKWPKTIITVGNRDPLYDDGLILMERMVQSGIDCECIIYEEISHGFLLTSMMIKQCEKTLKKSVQHLKKLIKDTQQAPEQ